MERKFTLDGYKGLSNEVQKELISNCLSELGDEKNDVIIDNVRIKNRDDFQNWLIENNIKYPK